MLSSQSIFFTINNWPGNVYWNSNGNKGQVLYLFSFSFSRVVFDRFPSNLSSWYNSRVFGHLIVVRLFLLLLLLLYNLHDGILTRQIHFGQINRRVWWKNEIPTDYCFRTLDFRTNDKRTAAAVGNTSGNVFGHGFLERQNSVYATANYIWTPSR